MIVGALRFPFCFRMPVDTAAPSVYANCGSWQEAQDTVSSAERRFSKYKYRPSSAFACEYGLFAGQESGGRPKGGFTWASAARHNTSTAGTSAPAAMLRFAMEVISSALEHRSRDSRPRTLPFR